MMRSFSIHLLVVFKWNAANPCAKTHRLVEPCQAYPQDPLFMRVRDFPSVQGGKLRRRQLEDGGGA